MKRESQYTLIVAGIILASFLLALGLTVRRLRESRREHPVPILMYHKIGDVDDNAWWVPAELFERQVRSLYQQGYTAILPQDLVDHRRAGKRLPDRPVILTFDDGYRDSLLRAEPILRRYGFRAVVYLVTDRIAGPGEAPRSYEGVECLTAPEIDALRRRGTFVFGGHGHAHENLAVLGDPYPNVRECFRRLRAHGIRRPAGFCYPHGQRNTAAVEAVRRAGFRSAVVCEDRVAVTGKALPLFELPRVSVMGGRHRFVMLQAPDPAGAVAVVRHEGIPLGVTPRWVWPGMGPGDGWLPAADIRTGDYAVPPPAAGPPVRLEVWDLHRLFLLASFSIRVEPKLNT